MSDTHELVGHIAEAKARKLQHTPGPWQSQHDFDWEGACTIIGNIDGPDDGRFHYTVVCDINEDPEEWFANRTLIIAAPEMLATLQAIASHDLAFITGPGRIVAEEMQRVAIATIAKATTP